MKRTAILSAIVSILVLGCTDDPASSSTANGSMGAKVNSSGWAATNVQSTWKNNVLSLGGSQISGAENKQINITGLVSAPGSYTINPFAGMNGSYTETSGMNVAIFTAGSGTLVVTELSATGAKGTFTFEANASSGATGTRSVTEGSFDVKFTQ